MSESNPFNQGYTQDTQYTAYGTSKGQNLGPQMSYSNYSEGLGQPLLLGERKKNFPRCYPVVHHNIALDIEPDKKAFVRKAYITWYVHAGALFWNFICLTGALVLGVTLTDFFYATAAFVLGVPISFYVYWFLYSAIRKNSASYFVLWFVCFTLQLIAEILYGIGVFGGAGFLLMIKAFDDNTGLGIMCVVSFFSWILLGMWNGFFFVEARSYYSQLGGNRAASKEFSRGAVQVAYDNRDTIKQVAVDNKDTIKQVAYENKDVIIDFAKEHRQEIQQTAYDNREMVARVALENKDTIWENRDAVQEVFGNQK